ncbi:GAP family protein [Microbacterium candidum]|uniref:GAP family protein n=1 Tax=Microbacterium candidum TaxID=3041922 RepID=A0ABT7N3M2_9MICO|nr:GAP family protein [Microbacterium sp. ASV49]MDL9981307.1 GAP family protein [Microbacterium sp. ASV49]
MGNAIGSILPLALGVAISPIPIIAAILMLLSPKAKVTGVGFLLGWVVGIVVAVTLFTVLSSALPAENSGSAPIKGTIQLVLGVLLLLLAVGQWRKRPKKGEEPTMPKWMQAIDKVSFWGALGLGFLLSALNPKNLILAVGAGTAIGAAALPVSEDVLVIAIYTIIAACTVAIPVIGYLIAADKLHEPLDKLRAWLTEENSVIMAVLLLVIGISMIGKGIAAF